MGNQEIAGFHFLARLITYTKQVFFLPSLSLTPPCKSNIIIHHTENARNVCCDTPYDPRRVYDSLGFHYRMALESAVHTIEHIQLSNAFKGTPRSPIDWGFWRSFSSFLTGSFVMWQLCWDKMPSVRPVMMYMYISEQLMSTTSSFRLNRLRQEEKKIFWQVSDVCVL